MLERAALRTNKGTAFTEVMEGSLQLGESPLRQLGESREKVEQALEEFRRATYSRQGRIIVGRSGTPG